ncbi:MAG: FixH family protein [Chitinophagaceae bacterium]|nr:FixH family protein [Chitinophagaceae bacterium]
MNWGYRLLFTFLAFGAMIGYLVIRSFGTTYELVEKDYYSNELAYQKVIDANKRTNLLQTSLTLNQTDAGITLQLPAEMKNKKVTGTVWFYCDYDQRKDFRIGLQTDTDAAQLIDVNKISPGDYLVKTTWDCDGQSYYAEKLMKVK